MLIFANVIEDAFSPLIKVFEEIMVFIHNSVVGGSWGLAIVGLTVLVRAVLVPLTYRQLKSMQEMQRLAPEMQALKEKYKDDKQRQQQELMKFYKDKGINPLASCLPLLLQFPVFISLFYMLRTDLKKHICGPQMVTYYNAHPSFAHTYNASHPVATFAKLPAKFVEQTVCNTVAPGSAKFLFIPDITAKATGVALVVLITLYVGSQLGLHVHRHGHRGSQPALAVPAAAGRVRGDPLSLPGRSAGLLDHHQSVDDRPAVHHPPAPTTARTTTEASQRQAQPIPAPGGRRGHRGHRQRTQGGGGHRAGYGLCRRAAAALAPQEEETLGQETMSSPEDRTPDPQDEELEPAELLEELLEEVADSLRLEVDVEVVEQDGILAGRLEGEDVGLLIGRHGQTIDAVQHLAQRIVFPDGPSSVRVVIDANGYRDRRAQALRGEADDAADQAVSSGQAVELDPLPPFERRIVHEYLRERGDVETHSEGDEPQRYLVVTPHSR